MEIKDNAFSRQFETTVNGKLLIVEYSLQERKIFLTRINPADTSMEDENIITMLKFILDGAYERKLKVVPVFPKIAAFFRKNPNYRDLLPPGIKI